MRVAVTGGAGFIGINAVARLLELGHEVTIIDNLSRAKVQANVDWLLSGERPKVPAIRQVDVRDFEPLRQALEEAAPDAIVHLAAQVAVTTSVVDPRTDFEINALGTLNVLEAARLLPREPAILFSSTNKVYGKLASIGVKKEGRRYVYAAHPGGISETAPLDFYSPYGCSKGTADQYVLDYGRIYGLQTTVLRQSCIYGTHQFGVEDQGWIAWFIIAAVTGRPITIYGDGCQVRDLLWVDDLVDLYLRILLKPEDAAGVAFNVGGGPRFALSLLESLDMIARELGREVPIRFADARPGDQEVFIADTTLANRRLGWHPRVGPEEGIGRLAHWVQANSDLFV